MTEDRHLLEELRARQDRQLAAIERLVPWETDPAPDVTAEAVEQLGVTELHCRRAADGLIQEDLEVVDALELHHAGLLTRDLLGTIGWSQDWRSKAARRLDSRVQQLAPAPLDWYSEENKAIGFRLQDFVLILKLADRLRR